MLKNRADLCRRPFPAACGAHPTHVEDGGDPRRLVMPLALIWKITGAVFSANRSAAAAVRTDPILCAWARFVRLPSSPPALS